MLTHGALADAAWDDALFATALHPAAALHTDAFALPCAHLTSPVTVHGVAGLAQGAKATVAKLVSLDVGLVTRRLVFFFFGIRLLLGLIGRVIHQLAAVVAGLSTESPITDIQTLGSYPENFSLRDFGNRRGRLTILGVTLLHLRRL